MLQKRWEISVLFLVGFKFQVLNELHAVYSDPPSKEFIERKQVWQEAVQTLETTCDLTEIITKDKSVELLLLKNDITNKVGLMQNIVLKCSAVAVK